MSRKNAFKDKLTCGIPRNLIGDWTNNQGTFRFDFNGNYYWVISAPYIIENDQVLRYQNDVATRISGNSGLIGTWRVNYEDNVWLDYIFGNHHFYAYEWDDGIKGGGYYSSFNNILTLIEQRGNFTCSGNNITLAYQNGYTLNGTFTITGNELVIQFNGQPVSVYTKVV